MATFPDVIDLSMGPFCSYRHPNYMATLRSIEWHHAVLLMPLPTSPSLKLTKIKFNSPKMDYAITKALNTILPVLLSPVPALLENTAFGSLAMLLLRQKLVNKKAHILNTGLGLWWITSHELLLQQLTWTDVQNTFVQVPEKKPTCRSCQGTILLVHHADAEGLDPNCHPVKLHDSTLWWQGSISIRIRVTKFRPTQNRHRKWICLVKKRLSSLRKCKSHYCRKWLQRNGCSSWLKAFEILPWCHHDTLEASLLLILVLHCLPIWCRLWG